MRGIKRLLTIARDNVSNEIAGLREGGIYARGLSAEGYSGGYRDALDDVVLALNGNIPQRHGWWVKREKRRCH